MTDGVLPALLVLLEIWKPGGRRRTKIDVKTYKIEQIYTAFVIFFISKVVIERTVSCIWTAAVDPKLM